MQPVQTDVFVNTEAHLHAVRQQHGTPENVRPQIQRGRLSTDRSMFKDKNILLCLSYSCWFLHTARVDAPLAVCIIATCSLLQ